MTIKGVQLTPRPPARGTPAQPNKQKTLDFQDILFRELAEAQQVKISAHAQKRMQERNINLDARDMARISKAVNQAGAKGVRESLVLYGELAMVASVTNRTIVTAMYRSDAGDRVFTNIDGAIIVNQ